MSFPVPLNAIRAIEIVGRRGALAPAAEELGVTPGAVSQHIRRAEERLGLALFERTPAGLVPTELLRAQLPRLSEGFSTLAAALAELKPDEGNALGVTMGSVFASRFLVSRLQRFSRLHPELELRLVTTGALLDMRRPDLDCAIRFGAGQWPHSRATRLGGTAAVPVCAPSLAAQLRTPDDLRLVPIIRDESTMLDWPEWLRSVGADPDMPLKGPTAFTDPTLAFEAAASGQGVLMAVDLMAADALRLGQLVAPIPHRAPIRNAYWFVTAEGRPPPRRVRQFRDWLFATVAEAEAQVPLD